MFKIKYNRQWRVCNCEEGHVRLNICRKKVEDSRIMLLSNLIYSSSYHGKLINSGTWKNSMRECPCSFLRQCNTHRCCRLIFCLVHTSSLICIVLLRIKIKISPLFKLICRQNRHLTEPFYFVLNSLQPKTLLQKRIFKTT